ncbi:MAG: ribokinase [Clostridia bacterium]|nr:ribokinase [Clostridia bacterium]
MAKILNIGSLNLDYVYAVPHFVAAGETLLSSRRDVFAGGKGLNQTVAAARAGAKVFHGGAVGADGGMLLDLLRDAGADVSAVARVDVPTGHAIIQVSPQGENSIIILGGANRAVSPETVAAALDKVDAGDILLLQNEINGLDGIIRRAAEKGLRILFNPAPMEASVKDLPLQLLDTLIVNEGEGQALGGDMDALRAAYPRQRILLTQGSRGACLWTGSECLFQPAFPVKAVDTTAAGDCFLGYYAAALAESLPYAEALRLAAAASALAVQRQGAAPSIPLRREVEGFLKGTY